MRRFLCVLLLMVCFSDTAYVACIGRGMFFGKTIPWIEDAIKAGYEAQDAIISELRAGNNAGNVAKAYKKSLTRTGHADMPLYGPCHATGQMEGEPPWIEDGSDYILRENMCFCTDIFLARGKCGLRVEDSVCVKEKCAENLTNYPREIIVV